MGISVGVADAGGMVRGTAVSVGDTDGGAVTGAVPVDVGKVCTEKLHPCMDSEIKIKSCAIPEHFRRYIELSLSAVSIEKGFFIRIFVRDRL